MTHMVKYAGLAALITTLFTAKPAVSGEAQYGNTQHFIFSYAFGITAGCLTEYVDRNILDYDMNILLKIGISGTAGMIPSLGKEFKDGIYKGLSNPNDIKRGAIGSFTGSALALGTMSLNTLIEKYISNRGIRKLERQLRRIDRKYPVNIKMPSDTNNTPDKSNPPEEKDPPQKPPTPEVPPPLDKRNPPVIALDYIDKSIHVKIAYRF